MVLKCFLAATGRASSKSASGIRLPAGAPQYAGVRLLQGTAGQVGFGRAAVAGQVFWLTPWAHQWLARVAQFLGFLEPTPEAALGFADWLHTVQPALADVSDSSAELWAQLRVEASTWYIRQTFCCLLLAAPSAVVLQQKWSRARRRIEAMIIAACPEVVKEELSSSRTRGVLSCCAHSGQGGTAVPAAPVRV